MQKCHLGLIGLAVMGSNLARNFASRGFNIVVFNRSRERTEEFIKEFGTVGPHPTLSFAKERGSIAAPPRQRRRQEEVSRFVAAYDYATFVKALKRPRKIMIMVKAGAAVDGVIADLLPYLEKGDIIIDGGNSFYRDTQRRYNELQVRGIQFVGCGVSGGEEGALKGPSLMPGGSSEAWKALKPYLEAIAAQDFSGQPCVTQIGTDGAGHYVKMVHNGIEYAVMQLIAEAYQVLSVGYKQTPAQISALFKKYNSGKLNSFLFEIASIVLAKKDETSPPVLPSAEGRKNRDPLLSKGEGRERFGVNGYLIDNILDRAGAKGTGAWTSADALERGMAIPSITEAVFARSISAAKDERVKLSKLYNQKIASKRMPIGKFQTLLEDALYVAMISCYAQGYELIRAAATAEGWKINLAEVSRIWEGGCIIRAKLLNVLHAAYQQNPPSEGGVGGVLAQTPHLFAIPGIIKLMKKCVPDLREFVSLSGASGISTPVFAASLFYFQDMTTAKLPANMIQGLRDFFGAHTYERLDKPGSFHTDWL